MALWSTGGSWSTTESPKTSSPVKKKKSGKDLAARFAAIGDAIETDGEKELFQIAVLVKDAASANAHKGKTGQLKAGYAVRMRHRGNVPVAVVGTLVPYATYFEFAKDIGGSPYLPDVETPRALYKALDDNTTDIVERIAAAIGRGLGAVEGA